MATVIQIVKLYLKEITDWFMPAKSNQRENFSYLDVKLVLMIVDGYIVELPKNIELENISRMFGIGGKSKTWWKINGVGFG